MPHLKVTPFDTSIIVKQIEQSSIMKSVAKALTTDDLIIEVAHAGEEFLLESIEVD